MTETISYRTNPQLPDPAAGGGPLHAVAMLTAIATFPLIFMGGLVTSNGAGMSVPDWPNSFGYNMFLFPPSQWLGPIFYEHTHRLMGTVVGFCSIILVITTYLTRWAGKTEKKLAWGVLGLVIFQGVLGGLRVVWHALNLAIVHACVAQAFFCYATFFALWTSRWWQQRYGVAENPDRRLPRFGMIAVGMIFAQLFVGAMMRHYQAGLAIPDFPMSYGHILPPTSHAALESINAYRRTQPNLDDVTLSQIWLHFGHRIGALLVTLMVLHLATVALRRYSSEPKLRKPALMLLGLIPAQVALGIMTVLFRKPADIASAHVAVGALVLVTAFVLTARSWRYVERPQTNLDSEPAPGFPVGDLAGAA